MSGVKTGKKPENRHFSVGQRPFLRKINLENRGGCGIMDSVMFNRIRQKTMSHKAAIRFQNGWRMSILRKAGTEEKIR